ncbi:MAG: AAA family ATPase [Candidatus Obscuribacter sp.]|nr:AAA family ATPase [Candidatus Obscuribacter sp.]
MYAISSSYSRISCNENKSVHIKNLWGYRDISISSFHPDVNFFIGVNGSGKTAVVNLLAAALKLDFPMLDKIQFEEIEISLTNTNPELGTAHVTVKKLTEEKSPYADITYTIQKDGKLETFSLTALENMRQFRIQGLVTTMSYPQHPDVRERLSKLVDVNWLSIHRITPNIGRDDRSYESTVDKKLDLQSRELGKFLSGLNSADKTETEKFQKEIFLSLVPTELDTLLESPQVVDFRADIQSLKEIFASFKVSTTDSTLLDKYAQKITEANQSIADARTLNDDQRIAVFNALRLHKVVAEWHKLLKTRSYIFERRDAFLEVMNSLLLGKTIEFTAKNEAVAKLNLKDANKTVQINDLSSGEKQLFIVLAEALLNPRKEWVYIADEPELSLHVNWQSVLVDSIRRISKNAQLIFATHS